MKIENVLNTGNFSIQVEGEFSPEAEKEALTKGLQYILQRDVATKVYTEVAGTVRPNGKGKSLDEKFERASVKYAEDTAAKFVEVAGEALKGKGNFTVTVVQYVSGEASPMAGATKYVEALMSTEKTEEGMRSIFSTLGMEDAETATKSELIAFAHKMKFAAR